MDPRRIVSYDDLVPPPGPALPPPPPGPQGPTAHTNGTPFYSNLAPAKRRKRSRNQNNSNNSNNQRANKRQKAYPQHWDDPSAAGQMAPPPAGAGASGSGSINGDISMVSTTFTEEYQEEYEDYEEEEEESRELTAEEVWDDSALIDAWNSAQAEYEAFHGTGNAKNWKNSPVKRSPLWYNKPPDPSTLSVNQSSKEAQSTAVNGAGKATEENSAPLNFDTFVPMHDASLTAAAQAGSTVGLGPVFGAGGAMRGTQDEAFQNAMNAMYWTGYWTAVYHSHSSTTKEDDADADADATAEEEQEAEGDEEEVEDEVVVAEADDSFVSTQR